MQCNGLYGNQMQRPTKSGHYASWKDWVMKAGSTGVIAGAAAFLLGDKSTLTVSVISIPSSVGFALGAAGGSISADLAHQYIFPLIPHNEKYDNMEATSLSIAASGLGTYAAASLFGPANFMQTFALGAGAYVAGDFVWSNYLGGKPGPLLQKTMGFFATMRPFMMSRCSADKAYTSSWNAPGVIVALVVKHSFSVPQNAWYPLTAPVL